MKRFSILLALLLPLLAYAGEAGQTLIKSDLKQEPFADAHTVATLEPNTAVEVIKRQGGWMQVKPATGAEGWVKMTTIKFGGPGASAKGDTGLSSLWNAASQGRSGNTGVTVATGVRRLSPEDMKKAKPAPDEVKKLDDFAATRSQAKSLAKTGNLSKHEIDYLAEAKPAPDAKDDKGMLDKKEEAKPAPDAKEQKGWLDKLKFWGDGSDKKEEAKPAGGEK